MATSHGILRRVESQEAALLDLLGASGWVQAAWVGCEALELCLFHG